MFVLRFSNQTLHFKDLEWNLGVFSFYPACVKEKLIPFEPFDTRVVDLVVFVPKTTVFFFTFFLKIFLFMYKGQGHKVFDLGVIWKGFMSYSICMLNINFSHYLITL